MGYFIDYGVGVAFIKKELICMLLRVKRIVAK